MPSTSSSRSHFTSSRLTSLFKTPIIPSSHDISSFSSLKNPPSNNETTNTNAKPPPPKRKRLTLMTGFYRTDYPSCNGSHWMASWHRRRCSLRPQDEFSNIKIASPLIPTAEASRRSRSKPLKVLPIGVGISVAFIGHRLEFCHQC